KYQEVMDLLISHNLLNENAIIVFEADRDIVIDESCYSKRRDYKYGEIKVAILWR
ncbi:MAG: RsmD family RNA methyltransferase, partial [Bacilli bacterium]|nr:RsmD family RNA methyltransferase [Bacilli bacterium]